MVDSVEAGPRDGVARAHDDSTYDDVFLATTKLQPKVIYQNDTNFTSFDVNF
jgi:hypothetical protein